MAILEEKDRQQIHAHGLTEEEVHRQIGVFEKGAPYADLDRPCTVGDGIRQLSAEEIERYVSTYRNDGAHRHLTTFVPASGAATRMFKALLKIAGEHERIERDAISRKASEKGEEYQDVLEFVDNIEKFAFYNALSRKMQADGHDIERLRRAGDFTAIISYVLTGRGLDYSNSPKGQILFHYYPEGSRTAFEEHLVEAAEYARDDKGDCFLHFTVSPEHEAGFKRILDETGPVYENAHGVRFDVRFTHQHPSTDTIAVDMDNRPFRDADGNLLFRPGGHGALIGNLGDFKGDMVFIKNIDNVVPDHLKAETILWKKVLAGYLLAVESAIDGYRRLIEGGDAEEQAVADTEAFVEKDLNTTIPPHIKQAPVDQRRRFVLDRLDRPLRVCGMVPTSGEAGGGPFWVRSPDGGLSIQIVESAQIDPEDPGQQAILKNLTHFNPVDIVCSLRDKNNQPYDLGRFVDESAVFISWKSKDGRDLKALEHPGLWNGAMAFWNTVFVEVPLITFNPVKTVNDLLRDTHQS